MNIEELKHKVEFNPEKWRWNDKTNCYSYALGLDVPDWLISRKIPPYYLGYLYIIYETYFNTWQKALNFLENYSYNERIELDLKTIDTGFSQIDYNDKLRNANERKIVYFKCKDKYAKTELRYGKNLARSTKLWHSFHFYVQDYDGIWKHKNGYKDVPTIVKYDPFEYIKYDQSSYEYQCTYRLALKNKKRK